jgi:tRNA threonylcarbamoyl adenosine modification protein YjeE
MSSKNTKTYHSFSSEETKKLGEELAGEIKRGKGAVVFALKGELGAGKTTFAQGFFKGLGLKKRSPSPTFIIMRRHSLLHAGAAHGDRASGAFKNIFHVDAYRLKRDADFDVLGFGDIFADPRNIVLIEWAERARRLLPKGTVWLQFHYGKHENERRIIIKR